MKNSKLILLLSTVLLLSGCAKEMQATDGAAVVTPPVVNPTFPVGAPPGQGAGSAGDSWSYGATVALNIDSLEIMSIYTGVNANAAALNNPTNVKLNVNLMDAGENHYAGQIKIAYDDAGAHHESYFAAATGKNSDYDSYGTAKDVGLYQAQYNTWFNGGKNFSGYFQDSWGAVVLVIDSVVSNGDGQGASSVNGSIWFKNFQYQFSTQGAERYCWFIYRGPYSCRSTTMMDKSSPYPSDGYRRLGTFTGLTLTKAFNQ